MARPGSFDPTDNVEFHTYVGLCITAWARVDEELFKICKMVLATKEEMAAIIYYRVNTLGGRLDLVGELVPHVLPTRQRKDGGHDHPNVKKWTDLKKAVRDQLDTRTAIAHYPVDVRFRQTSQMGISASFQIFVSQAESLRGRHSSARPLTVTDLSQHCRTVQALAESLRTFRRDVLQAHSK